MWSSGWLSYFGCLRRSVAFIPYSDWLLMSAPSWAAHQKHVPSTHSKSKRFNFSLYLGWSAIKQHVTSSICIWICCFIEKNLCQFKSHKIRFESLFVSSSKFSRLIWYCRFLLPFRNLMLSWRIKELIVNLERHNETLWPATENHLEGIGFIMEQEV